MNKTIRKAVSVLLACLAIGGSGAAAIGVSAKSTASEKTTQKLSLSFDGSPITLTKGKTYTLPAFSSKLIPGLSCAITASSSSKIRIDGDKFTATGTGKVTLTITLPDGKKYEQDFNITPPKISFRFNKTALSLGVGESAAMKALLSSAGSGIKWSSSDKKVLTVDNEGNIKAKKTGSSVVTATLANGEKTSCKITVKKAPKTITLSKGTLTLGTGETTKLDCLVNAGSAAYNVTFSSSDPKTVYVDKKTGKLTANKTGKAVITAKTQNGKTAKCTVFVKAAPTKLILKKTSITLKEGESTMLRAVLPSGTASGKLTFTPSNDSIVKVDTNGLVKAIKKGSAYVLVKTYNGKTAYCNIKVV